VHHGAGWASGSTGTIILHCGIKNAIYGKRLNYLEDTALRIHVAALLLLLLSPVQVFAQDAASPAAAAPAVHSLNLVYVLGAGDKVHVTVYGEPDLSGDFAVNGTGDISFPLIGDVHAAGLTVTDLGASVQDHLKAGYLVDPKVSVEITSFRPYYIMGEVAKTGEYPYSDGLNVINAIARAEGFTYRAQKKRVFIKHFGETNEVEVPLTNDLLVMPGDTIRISERHW